MAAAMEALLLVAEQDGPPLFARIGIMRAINRHVERVFDPSRKDKHWGRRKLARDQSKVNLREPLGQESHSEGNASSGLGITALGVDELDGLRHRIGDIPRRAPWFRSADRSRPCAGLAGVCRASSLQIYG